MRLSEPAPERLHKFEGNAHAGQDGALAAAAALRISHGHVLRHEIGRLVMVGDSHADAGLHKRRGFSLAGDAAVHRHDETGIERAQARDGSLRNSVAFLEAPAG